MAFGRWRVWGVVFALGVLLAACGGKGPQYPEDHLRFTRIDAAIEGLRRAYVERNLSGFRDYLLPSDKVDRLEREVEADLQAFKQIALDITVERILIEQEAIEVSIHWQGQWKRSLDETGVRERGHGRLQFVGTQSILLEAADGNLPFGMSGRSLPAPSASTPAPR